MIKLSGTLDCMTTIEPSYPPRGVYPRLGILAFGLFLVGTNAFVIAGLLPSIARTLAVPASDVSYSISFYAIVVAVAAPLVSTVTPRMSRTTLMTIGLGLIAVGTAIAALAGTIELFTAGRVVAALGGAALVPAATAAAATMVPPERRGRAIAFVAIGFTLASAVGSPLGTAIGAIGGWQLPLFGVAGLAALLAVVVASVVRGVPIGAAVPLAHRFALLRDRRVLMALLATLFLTAGFNVVYIFSSEITSAGTGGAGGLLAILLLLYGVGGIVGNLAAGFITDRLGNRLTAGIFLAAQVLILVALRFAAADFVVTAAVFLVWGVVSFAAVPPIQHRLVTLDPATSALALSWYTTAMYVGIATAPPLGSLALATGGPGFVPLAGAIAAAVAFLALQLGYLLRKAGTTKQSDLVGELAQ